MLPLKFVDKIYNYKLTLDEAKGDQDKLEKLIIRLENCNTKIIKKKKKIEEKNKLFEICSKIVLCERRYY